MRVLYAVVQCQFVRIKSALKLSKSIYTDGPELREMSFRFSDMNNKK